jgi:hypothetical protein
MSARDGRTFLFALTIFVLCAATELYSTDKTGLEPSRDSIIRIVTQIQRADYEGDCPTVEVPAQFEKLIKKEGLLPDWERPRRYD